MLSSTVKIKGCKLFKTTTLDLCLDDLENLAGVM